MTKEKRKGGGGAEYKSEAEERVRWLFIEMWKSALLRCGPAPETLPIKLQFKRCAFAHLQPHTAPQIQPDPSSVHLRSAMAAELIAFTLVYVCTSTGSAALLIYSAAAPAVQTLL